MSPRTFTRRHFIVASAVATGGLLVGCRATRTEGASRSALAGEADPPVPVGAWVRIAGDGAITILLAHAEMGQGVYTALPMIVAEELEADWSHIGVEMAPTMPASHNPLPGPRVTGGSRSVRANFDLLARAGAAAREMLRKAAAARFDAPLAECIAERGAVVHRPSARRLGYGALAADAAALTPPQDVAPKPRSQRRIVGTRRTRLDTPAKLRGEAEYGIDVRIDGMLHAAIAHAPTIGGRLVSVDDAPALALPGVRHVVALERAVVVAADSHWQARRGLAALEPEWESPPDARSLSSEGIAHAFRTALDGPAAPVDHTGDAAAALASAATRLEAVYEVPFLAHAALEPMNATARVTADGAEIWAPTQVPGRHGEEVAQALGLAPEAVNVNTTFLGGSFGRRLESDYAVEAALVSQAMGAPVQLLWSREEDTRNDFYRPASVARLRAGLDAAGKLVAWESRLVAPSVLERSMPEYMQGRDVDPAAVEGLAAIPYAVPNQRCESVLARTPVPIGWWRSVGYSSNAFFVEAFVDEVAHAASADPVEMRLALLADQPRHRRVLERAAETSGWSRPAPSGRFRGVAMHACFESVVAQVVELSLPEPGKIRIHRVTCAVDCGDVVNPDTVEAQIEGGVVFGLSSLFQEVAIREGRVVPGNFDSFPLLRLAQTPQIDVHVLDEGGAMGGIGEVGVPPVAPAVANALFAARGERVRTLPLTRHGLRLA